ncbi:MAG TPA: hypothetical protein VMX17_17530 [Candidatus Glassbacteria bacterium]|nr:hypothetical protein [Candidatus Glassbacteria bacterium]
MDSEKISNEDSILVELHRERLKNAEQQVKLREAQIKLLVLSLFKKYNLSDGDNIGVDGTIFKKEVENDNG